jgi:hypothetical protein
VNTASQLQVVEKVLASWRPWRHAWPYNRNRVQEAKSTRWTNAIAKVTKSQKQSRPSASSSRAATGAPGSGYPHFNLYPAVVKPSSSRDLNGYPHNLKSIYPVCSLACGTGDLSRSQYPHFEICMLPSFPEFAVPSDPDGSQDAPVYPYNLGAIYPAVRSRQQIPASRSLVKSGYPLFEICRSSCCIQDLKIMNIIDPSVYPFFNLYPGVAGSLRARSISKAPLAPTSTFNYPYFTLCKKTPLLFFSRTQS